MGKYLPFDNVELIGEGNVFEGGTAFECGNADIFEVFVADDALEGGAMGENLRFDDFEHIGESDTCEGGA